MENNKKISCKDLLRRYKELRPKMKISNMGSNGKFTFQAQAINSDSVKLETLKEYKNIQKKLMRDCKDFLPLDVQEELRV